MHSRTQWVHGLERFVRQDGEGLDPRGISRPARQVRFAGRDECGHPAVDVRFDPAHRREPRGEVPEHGVDMGIDESGYDGASGTSRVGRSSSESEPMDSMTPFRQMMTSTASRTGASHRPVNKAPTLMMRSEPSAPSTICVAFTPTPCRTDRRPCIRGRSGSQGRTTMILVRGRWWRRRLPPRSRRQIHGKRRRARWSGRRCW